MKNETFGTGPLAPASPGAAEDAARMSLLGHDLRAAVSDIIGGLRLIDRAALDEGTRIQIERVRAAGEVLARLLEEGLAVMPGDAAAAGPADLRVGDFLHDLEMRWTGRARERGLRFHVAAAPDLPEVLTLDRLALDRALSNMIANAIKYTDAGEVRLAVLLDPEGWLEFSIRDQGPGFSDAALGRLFEFAGRPLDAAKPGFGLGMHICKKMSGRLGAQIGVRNLTEGGAEVTLRLPVRDWGVVGDSAGPLPCFRGARVLVAEDGATNQAILGHMLTRLGATAVLAADGEAALAALAQEPFDLALIDIEMPRRSGLDVIAALRAGHGGQPELPVVAVTAYVLRSNREAIHAAGADAILAKPLAGIETFANAISAACALRGQPQGACLPPVSPSHCADPTADPLDPARFAELLALAGPDQARDLIQRLIADLLRVERQLVAALSQGDTDALRAQAHVLLAVAGAVGAAPLTRLAEDLNAAVRREDAVAIQSLGAETLTRIDRLIQFARRELAARFGA
ncbi:ATP-binding response regulator [Phaeovulum vinaykumarii]|uniref:Histidine kinase-, DNA gyrase B-, and HSP90-like ATPase n=2 Tax=Phaeovulum vinaykumarii TaxID=407234 RepID=A0A1N7L6V5_9RHOB|nr:ATP-binding protein [Phaeovulum vinaykumarii]SIS69536.1 Histidine kinase-, DNA gyrase B-, and HSP90-like ATPase [Phaeovulum vinaykumarii]SOB99442.1 histidine kinase/DNA gyrase B/HSP90-like ATPase [Phaeovulum vinaykumarii]